MIGTSYQELDKCPCANTGNFVGNTAECVSQNDPADLPAVWQEMSASCNWMGWLVNYSENKFLNGGQKVASSSIANNPPTSTSTYVDSAPSNPSTPTATAGSSSNSSNNGDGVGKLSGGMIGLIGAMAGVGCLIIALVGCYYKMRRKNKIATPFKTIFHEDKGYSEYSKPKGPWTGIGVA